MHYSNGREAKAGDPIVGKDCGGNPIGGILVRCHAGSTTCNGQVVPMSVIDMNNRTVTLGDCLHLDDFNQKAAAPAAAQQ